MDISKRISQICEQRGIRQKDLLLNDLGSNQKVGRVFKGSELPTLKFVAGFIDMLDDIDVRWLITGKNTDRNNLLTVEDSNVGNNVIGDVSGSKIQSISNDISDEVEIYSIQIGTLSKEVKDKEEIIELLKEQIALLKK
jgi:hypothetical protein